MTDKIDDLINAEIARHRKAIADLKAAKLSQLESSLPVPRIEVFGKIGPSGDRDFGPHKLVWFVQIVYPNGNSEEVSSWMSSGFGSAEKRYAVKLAQEKSNVSGFPVVDRGDLSSLLS